MKKIIGSAAMVVLFFLANTFAYVTPRAWYRGGENDVTGQATAMDFSPNCFDMTPYGSPVVTTAVGISGSSQAYRFDGTGYFKYDTPVITAIYNWGIEAWINPSVVANSFIFNIGGGDGGYSLIIDGGKFLGLLNGRDVLVGPDVTPNVWTHVAFINTKASDTDNLVKLYVNGNLVASANTFPHNFQSDAVTTIGASPSGGSCFTGDIDEARAFTFEPGAFAVSDLLYPVVPIPAAEPWESEVTPGHRILVQKGLQLVAYSNPGTWYQPPLDWDRLAESHFTTVDTCCWPCPAWWGIAPGERQWVKWADPGRTSTCLDADELPFLPTMVAYQYLDENNITVPAVVQTLKDWFSLNRRRYPNVISYDDQAGRRYSYAANKAYVMEAKPDMVMTSSYPFNGEIEGGSPTDFYETVQQFRLLGLAGLDGNGNQPIPYALYIQGIPSSSHVPSESELRLNQFAAWAFGYKYVSIYRYVNAPYSSYSTFLFTDARDASPTNQFYQIAETNRQSRNLGPTLIRLLSTDIRMVMGQYWGRENWWESKHTIDNPLPSGISAWSAGAGSDAYLTGISATNLGSKNDGKRGDVIIGFFKPLHESFDGDEYSSEKYFMVVNGLSDGSGTVAATQQKIRLTFNFGLSSITSLQRLSRDSGTIEIVPLASDGNGGYYLDLVLDGGTGDLFKYNTGAPFVGIEEVSAPSLVVSPETQTVAKEAGTATFTVSNAGTGTMVWTAEVISGSDWLSITSGQSGSDNGSIVVSFTKNRVPETPRTARIQITSEGAAGSPRTVMVVQSAPNLIPGDANKDCMVDVGDLGILAANYGMTSDATWSQGDFNDDDAVDVGDLGILAANYGTGSSSGSSFDADYAKVFGATSDKSSSSDDDSSSSICSSLGLPLITGLAILGLMLIKLDE